MIAYRSPLNPSALTLDELVVLPRGAKLLLFSATGKVEKVRWSRPYNPNNAPNPHVILRRSLWGLRRGWYTLPADFLGLIPVSEGVRRTYGDTFTQPFEGGWTVEDGWNMACALVVPKDDNELPSRS